MMLPTTKHLFSHRAVRALVNNGWHCTLPSSGESYRLWRPGADADVIVDHEGSIRYLGSDQAAARAVVAAAAA